MITSVHIENFKCFKEFDIELGKFNVLIGPNGSGKTSFLQAIGLCSAYLGRPELRQIEGPALLESLGISPGPHLLWCEQADMRVVLNSKENVSSQFRGLGILSKDGRQFRLAKEFKPGYPRPRSPSEQIREEEEDKESKDLTVFCSGIGRIAYHKFDPAILKSPNGLLADWLRLGPDGLGLANLVGTLRLTEEGQFKELNKAFCERFPDYVDLAAEPEKVRHEDDAKLGLRFRTRHGQLLPAEAVSDGTILSLAFLAITHVATPPGVLLIEEPEHGVHHASLKEIIATLRALSEKKNVQVILTTHSPYLLDCVEPEDVLVFRKDKEGVAHAARLSEYPDVEDLKKHFMTGEIWTGMDEDDIVTRQKVSG